MCSIYGAFGRAIGADRLAAVRELARDRGRDGGGSRPFNLGSGRQAVLGAWRATPTTETQAAPPQPYGGVVHNGTIANDAELGNPPGQVDSLVLPAVLDRSSASALAASLGRVRGSYALAVAAIDRVYLAANYKPLHYLALDGAIYFASMERHLLPLAPWGVRPARLAPYSVLDLLTGDTASLRPAQAEPRRTLVVCSGGLDSATAAWALAERGDAVTLLHFQYGCRAQTQEALTVRRLAGALGVPAVVLPLPYADLAGGSPLLGGADTIAAGLEGAEFASEWVPARNLVMLAHAVAYAEAHGFGTVALGNNLEEAGAYPDNEEQFTVLLDQVLDHAVHDGCEVRIEAPLGALMKHEIVALGTRLGVPYGLTWSCYRGGAAHCGACGPCFMREVSFQRNGLADPAPRANAPHGGVRCVGVGTASGDAVGAAG